MDVRVGLWRKLSIEELLLLNCGVGEDSWESLGLQGDPPVHSKGDQSWVFIGRSDAEAETPILWPPDVKIWLIGKTLMLGGFGDRRWRGQQKMRWLDDITDLDIVWVNSGSWWWTGRPGVLWFMWSQRVGHDWATELNWDAVGLCALHHSLAVPRAPPGIFLFLHPGYSLFLLYAVWSTLSISILRGTVFETLHSWNSLFSDHIDSLTLNGF